MPSLGLSQTKFQIDQQHNFKVYGDGLSNSVVTALTTHAPGLAWTNITTPGSGQDHVNVKAKLIRTHGQKITDTVGDLTVTVTDGTTTTQQTFSPVTYTP